MEHRLLDLANACKALQQSLQRQGSRSLIRSYGIDPIPPRLRVYGEPYRLAQTTAKGFCLFRPPAGGFPFGAAREHCLRNYHPLSIAEGGCYWRRTTTHWTSD